MNPHTHGNDRDILDSKGMNSMSNNNETNKADSSTPNGHTISFLASLDDQACALIFTRNDANRILPEDRGPLTDDEWRNIVRDFGKTHPADWDWESFESLIHSNIDSSNIN